MNPNTARDSILRHVKNAESRSPGLGQDAAYECAAREAARMIDQLDRGARLPDAWMPFAPPARRCYFQNAPTSPTWAIADLAEAAAAIADHAEPDMHGGGHEWRDGTARAIKAEADNQLRQIRNAIRELPTNAYNQHQLAAMLAVGAARYGTRRKDDDLAGRAADHLRQLAPTTPDPSTPADQ